MFSRHTNRTFLNLGEKKICETTKDTGDNDDHFYVVPSEKIKFIRISNLLILYFYVESRIIISVRLTPLKIQSLDAAL